MKIGEITLTVSNCTTGIYLRWWFNGWHYFLFTNGYEVDMATEEMDNQITRLFSRISKVEHPTKIKAEYSYQITLEGITSGNIQGFIGLLLAEQVEQYEDGVWRVVELTRGDYPIRNDNENGYVLSFEITRKELPNTPAVYQKSIKLYLGDVLCDLDLDEIVPINKQVNDIAELQDRQSDFTAQFKIRKTRAMEALLERSGDTGANTNFPFENQTCRLVQNGIEMITGGILILEHVDDQYYYVSILSGNLNFFKEIEDKKLVDLIIASTDHTWDRATMAASHAGGDYIYPLCEPSDDGGLVNPQVVGNSASMYGGLIWPFIKVKAIWDEIFDNSKTGLKYYVSGYILTDDTFLKLFMPIANLKQTNATFSISLYSLSWVGSAVYITPTILKGNNLIVGDAAYLAGTYVAPYTAKYKIGVWIELVSNGAANTIPLYLYDSVGGLVETFTLIDSSTGSGRRGYPRNHYEVEYTATTGDGLQVYIGMPAVPFAYVQVFYYYNAIIEIIPSVETVYGNAVTPMLNMPDMTQIDFIKMICNMFGLVPDVTARDKTIYFWSYEDLYDNILAARDWSAYLSERDDESEFKFGDYAQNNYFKYKESEDVIPGNGPGIMQINDQTRPKEKDILELPVSTCDEVIVTTTDPITISRIAFNEYDAEASAAAPPAVLYKSRKSIDPRIVYVKEATGITFKIYDGIGGHSDVANCKIATSSSIAFSSLVVNYAGLSRLLTKTNLRRAKFNLPVYEVAGLKHYIPVYLKQYKAYFYVNKISNYVPGKLCIVELIKL